MRFFEDIAVGERHSLGAHTFTPEDIKRFAGAFDPQPFHTDEIAAEQTHFGRLCASGWHTVAVWMKVYVRYMQDYDAALEASGVSPARLGPSPGFDDLRWLKPVYAGDTISFQSEVIAKRASRSRPAWGILSMRNNGRNQAGDEVVSFTGLAFVERRDKREAQGTGPELNAPGTPPAS